MGIIINVYSKKKDPEHSLTETVLDPFLVKMNKKYAPNNKNKETN